MAATAVRSLTMRQKERVTRALVTRSWWRFWYLVSAMMHRLNRLSEIQWVSHSSTRVIVKHESTEPTIFGGHRPSKITPDRTQLDEGVVEQLVSLRI